MANRSVSLYDRLGLWVVQEKHVSKPGSDIGHMRGNRERVLLEASLSSILHV